MPSVPGPGSLTALCSLVLYPTLADKESGFIKTIIDPLVFPSRSSRDYDRGICSRLYVHHRDSLNWGASYLVNDFYRRFLIKGPDEKHYVEDPQVATVSIMLVSCVVTYYQDSISNAWRFLIAIGAGTGSVFILRWFWWRINAWSEVAAMAASFFVSLLLQLHFGLNNEDPLQFAWIVLITVASSTVIWLAVTMITAP